MKKILIIGNGFDLHHKLPSQYSDFIKVLTKISEMKDNLPSIKYTDFFEDNNEFYNVESIIFDREKIYDLKNLIKDNVWFNYFKEVLSINTWIDFETEIQNSLETINIFINNLEPFLRENISFSGDLSLSGMKSYPTLFKNHDFRNKLERLKIIEVKNQYVIFNKDYLYRIGNQVQHFKEDNLYEDLIKSLEDFILIFNRYFIDILSVFYNQYNNHKKLYFDEVYKREETQNNLLDRVSKVISFNFTPTIEKYYNKPHLGIEYLHGKIDENNNTQNIILGINKSNFEIKNKKLYHFTKQFQIAHKNPNFDFLGTLKQESDLIFIFWGHSLDISDGNYIEEIFDLVSVNHNCSIKIFFHERESKTKLLENLFRIIGSDKVLNLINTKRVIFISSEISSISQNIPQ